MIGDCHVMQDRVFVAQIDASFSTDNMLRVFGRISTRQIHSCRVSCTQESANDAYYRYQVHGKVSYSSFSHISFSSTSFLMSQCGQ